MEIVDAGAMLFNITVSHYLIAEVHGLHHVTITCNKDHFQLSR